MSSYKTELPLLYPFKTKKHGINDIEDTEGQSSFDISNTIIGNKGKGLQELCALGINVPPGFTITTDVCSYFHDHNKEFSPVQESQICLAISEIEANTTKSFGAQIPDTSPLLLAVRSGAHTSMPGVMNTVLNVGINDKVHAYLQKINRNFADECYKKLIIMLGTAFLDIEKNIFKPSYTVEECKNIILEYGGCKFPQDVYEQLWWGIKSVFVSCKSDKAQQYQKIINFDSCINTAVTIQAMVLGNFNVNSGSGVVFSRNPNNGEKCLFGEFVSASQGDKLVDGTCNPQNISYLKRIMPAVYSELNKVMIKLEKHFKDIVDVEFTIEDSQLWLLQVRRAHKNTITYLRTTVDMFDEGLLTLKEAIEMLPDNVFDILTYKQLVSLPQNIPSIVGLPISFGCAVGEAVFSSEEALVKTRQNKDVILISNDIRVDDVICMHNTQGMISINGGATSHGAVVARTLGLPLVSNLHNAQLKKGQLIVGENHIKSGDKITIDGVNGKIYLQELALHDACSIEILNRALNLINRVRSIKVRANADSPEEVKKALKFSAQGVGLCRTEHMFFHHAKMLLLQKIILADNGTLRQECFHELLNMQKEDFSLIMKAAGGYAVNIRLLDPPLHEFMPTTPKNIASLAASLQLSIDEITKRIADIKEVNPMLGKRGIRLGLFNPAIYDMQIKAIFDAMYINNNCKVEIMLPLISAVKEVKMLKDRIAHIANDYPIKMNYSFGIMIETPRSALIAHKLAPYVDFFSFGTNDLTQMTYGISRDDFVSFKDCYLNQQVFSHDPFESLDTDGVGELMKIAVIKARKINPKLRISMCGEQVADNSSINFIHSFDKMPEIKTGFDYISCSPHKVPTTILLSAKNWLKSERNDNVPIDKILGEII